MSRKKYRDFDEDPQHQSNEEEEVDVNEFVDEEYDGYVLDDEDDLEELNFED